MSNSRKENKEEKQENSNQLLKELEVCKQELKLKEEENLVLSKELKVLKDKEKEEKQELEKIQELTIEELFLYKQKESSELKERGIAIQKEIDVLAKKLPPKTKTPLSELLKIRQEQLSDKKNNITSFIANNVRR